MHGINISFTKHISESVYDIHSWIKHQFLWPLPSKHVLKLNANTNTDKASYNWIGDCGQGKGKAYRNNVKGKPSWTKRETGKGEVTNRAFLSPSHYTHTHLFHTQDTNRFPGWAQPPDLLIVPNHHPSLLLSFSSTAPPGPSWAHPCPPAWAIVRVIDKSGSRILACGSYLTFQQSETASNSIPYNAVTALEQEQLDKNK